MIAIGIGANSRAHRNDFAVVLAGVCREVDGCDVVATLTDAVFAPFVEAAAKCQSIAYRPIALEALQARSEDCLTRSERALDRFGVASIAEAAALVAAGSGSRLIVPRRIIGSITVAAARSAEGVS